MMKLLKKIAILGLVAVFVMPNSAMAAIALDATSTGGNASYTDTLTISHAVTAGGANRALIVNVGSWVNCTAATYNGVAMTKGPEATYGAGTVRTTQFYLVAPATGTHNVVITCDSAQSIGGVVSSYTGVDQVTPVNVTGTGGVDGSSSYTLSVTTTVDNTMLVDATGNINGGGFGTVGAGQTSLGSAYGGSNDRGVAGSYKVAATAGSNSVSRTSIPVNSTNPATVIALTPAAEVIISVVSDLILFGDW